MIQQPFETAAQTHTRIGREQGYTEGMQNAVLRQIALKFGPLNEEVRQRIREEKNHDALFDLAERLLEAQSLDELALSEKS